MTEKEALELINYFVKRGSFEEKIWSHYRLAKKNLLNEGSGPAVYNSLIKSLERPEETLLIHCIEILADIGNEKTIPFIKKIEFRPDILLFELYCPSVIKILETKSSFDFLKFSKKPTKDLIGTFSKHGSKESGEKHAFILEEHYYAKRTLIEHGSQILNDLFKIIDIWERLALEVDFNSILFQTEEYCRTKLNKLYNILDEKLTLRVYQILKQGETGKTCLILHSALLMFDSIVAEVAEVLGEIGNISAIDYLKKILKYYCTGMTSRKIASALVKLGDKKGYDFLVDQVRNPDITPEVRIKCAAELYYLGLKNVFKESEVVDVEELPGQNLVILKKMIDRLKVND